MDSLYYDSVENIPGINAMAMFFASEALRGYKVDSSAVFKEDCDITPVTVTVRLSYMPWGSDNMLSYNIINLIESDETLSTPGGSPTARTPSAMPTALPNCTTPPRHSFSRHLSSKIK